MHQTASLKVIGGPESSPFLTGQNLLQQDNHFQFPSLNCKSANGLQSKSRMIKIKYK
jgi:hypothetical protein